MVDSSNMEELELTKSLRLTLDSKRDLTTLLDDNFGYKGSFSYSENRPDAPSLLLTITDIGPISLPLSEIDAKRIIACATQAPFGLGTSTVIDKKVRDTWQIDPSLVSFQNPTWDSFLQSNTASICSGLGLPDYHRAALVVFNKEDMDWVMITLSGVKYGLDKLQTSLKRDNPTPEDRKIIDLLMQDPIRMQESDWKILAEFPLRLHDLDLWNKIIERANQRYCRCLIVLKEEMFLAWDTFGFQQVQSSYDGIFKSRYNGDAIDFIHEVKARAANPDEREIVGAWCDKHIVAFVKGDNLEHGLDSAKISKILL
ncbi:hypothetical protein JOM56_011933 [Amanita muscaria]